MKCEFVPGFVLIGKPRCPGDLIKESRTVKGLSGIRPEALSRERWEMKKT